MSYKTTRVAYNSSWDPSGIGHYYQQQYIPPPTPSFTEQRKIFVPSGGGSGSGGGSSSGDEGCTCEKFFATIFGIICTACIVLMVLIPNYPKSIPIEYVAIPATIFGIYFLLVLGYICQRNCCC